MSLPKVATPTFTVRLISQKKPVEFRPYLVKEEKILLMAQQSGDQGETKAAVSQIIDACTFGKLSGLKLPSFDLEMMLLQLRARSVNNVLDVQYQCQANTAEGTCKAVVPFQINIDDIKFTETPGHTNLIWLTDELAVTMRYPTGDDSDKQELIEMLKACIESIVMRDGKVFELAQEDPNQVTEFFESLTLPQCEKLRVFFDTMPKLEHKINFKCPKCQYEETITLSGLMDFFG